MACMERQLCLTFISVYGHIGKRFVMDVDIKISRISENGIWVSEYLISE